MEQTEKSSISFASLVVNLDVLFFFEVLSFVKNVILHCILPTDYVLFLYFFFFSKANGSHFKVGTMIERRRFQRQQQHTKPIAEKMTHTLALNRWTTENLLNVLFTWLPKTLYNIAYYTLVQSTSLPKQVGSKEAYIVNSSFGMRRI